MIDNKENVKVLEGGNKPNDLKQAVGEVIKNFETYKANIILQAQLTWIKFQALKKEGFTDIQAIELCKKLF